MKYIKTITTLIFLILSISSYGQNYKNKNYFPIWTFHQDDINIHGISLGLWTLNKEPRYTNTNGIKLELLGVGIGLPLIGRSPIPETDSAFFELQQKPLSERINGLNLSATGTFCHCQTNGLAAGLIGQMHFQVNGLSASLFVNFTQKLNGIMVSAYNDAYYMNGLQLGYMNSGSKTKGVQIGIFGNGAVEMKGLQIGLVNISKKLKGLQIGLFNKSKKLKGFQIGLWNVNQKRKLPFVNWNFKRDTE
jgi:hypothetical protein